MTQANRGTAAGFDTTVVTRLRGSGAQLDLMPVLAGGHGLNLHIKQRLGRTFVWMSVQGTGLKSPTHAG